MPPHLTKPAKAIWHRIVPEIDAMGLLTTADGEMVGELCAALASVHRLSKYLEKHGPSYEVHAPSGTLLCFRKRPEVSLLREAQAATLRLATHFGLTPVARSRLEVTAAYTSTVKRPGQPATPAPGSTTPPNGGDQTKPSTVIDAGDRFFRGG